MESVGEPPIATGSRLYSEAKMVKLEDAEPIDSVSVNYDKTYKKFSPYEMFLPVLYYYRREGWRMK